MVQARPRFTTFAEYLTYEDGLESRYEWINGELVELPPAAEPNLWIAVNVRDELIKVIFKRLIKLGNCELQVPAVRPTDPANRFPDLMVLREEHLPLMKKRATITLDMPPPQLVAEVVSPGQENYERDYVHKRDQYAARDIPEYWILNPE